MFDRFFSTLTFAPTVAGAGCAVVREHAHWQNLVLDILFLHFGHNLLNSHAYFDYLRRRNSFSAAHWQSSASQGFFENIETYAGVRVS